MIQADPPEDRQAEGDPESESAIIGDVEDRQGPEEVVHGRKSEGAQGSDRDHAHEECDARRSTTNDEAKGASQIKVASPANPPADSLRLCTPNARARLGWPNRWLPNA